MPAVPATKMPAAILDASPALAEWVMHVVAPLREAYAARAVALLEPLSDSPAAGYLVLQLMAAERRVATLRAQKKTLGQVATAEREMAAAWRAYVAERDRLEGGPAPLGADADRWLDLVGQTDQVRQDGDE